ncbi:hypothetical protein [Butyrivibrio sp. INlla21]|uniref:hypothetical protein n=1 Tax=Butyrivibrio sp. INlla21 TaxID=1520811 RepID=UPI0008EE9D3C|nr:hypothetical protein [Butyrivibrio sp. INlla21]SFU33690.1 hypothetical protein SAMN02910342_00133 [Butyrivibrio sp. INlla21]
MSYYDYGFNPYPNMGLIPNQMMPTSQQIPNQPRGDNYFVWVQGKEGAKVYPMAPEKTGLFLDDQKPYVYRKVTDKLGKTQEFKVFKLVEEPDEENISVDTTSYVTKEEFDKLTQELGELKAMVSSNKQKNYNGNKQGSRKALDENG